MKNSTPKTDTPHSVLHITNGDYFNRYFLSEFGGEAIPFREVMMEGDTLPEIFEKTFFALRAKELGVSIDEYKAKACVYDALQNNTYEELHLWFGKDTFCQVNLLTLLAYLELTSYMGRVFVNYIDDESFAILEKGIPVTLGGYYKLYEDILIKKRQPIDVGVLDKNAIALYFDYHAPTGKLSRLAQENAKMEKQALLALLIEHSKEYGLATWQVEKLLQANKKQEQTDE